MGHVRLGTLPKTRLWRKVVELISNGANVDAVAEATVNASQKALTFVQGDAGFQEAVRMLVQMGLAGKSKDPLAYLASIGVKISKGATVLDVALAVNQALQRDVAVEGRRSDFGEKAREALATAMVEHMRGRLGTLIEATHEDVAGQLRILGRPKAFGELGRTFFAKLTNECMQYFLSKTLATHVGEGQRFATLNQMAEFNEALETHCRESSVIVQDYCAGWFSSRHYEEKGQISQKSIDGFGWYALEKMRGEFAFDGDKDTK